jgi:hypothetical protein
MSEVIVVKGEDGKLAGLGEKGGRAWDKFLKRVASLAVGETLQFAWNEPRSPQHHRMFFSKLHALADRQEAFDDETKLRHWMTVGAGYCDLLPGPDGQLVAIPQSIAFHKLDEVEFGHLHAQVDQFLWSPHAQAFLWPGLSASSAYEAVDALMTEFS